MHNSNTSEYILFKSSPQSCLLLVDIFNMSICLIFSNWLSALHKNGRRKIWGELMNFLRCSMCPCFLRISLNGTGIDKTRYFNIWYLAWGDPPEPAWSQRANHASRLSGNTCLYGVLLGWCHLKGNLRGLVPGSQLSSVPVPVRIRRMDPSVTAPKITSSIRNPKAFCSTSLDLWRWADHETVRPDFTLKPQCVGTHRWQHNLDG